jgi:hypothetical protein
MHVFSEAYIIVDMSMPERAHDVLEQPFLYHPLQCNTYLFPKKPKYLVLIRQITRKESDHKTKRKPAFK